MSKTTLAEARERIINLFTQLKAEGVEVSIEHNYGGYGSLDLSNGKDPWIELTNTDWHPEWKS